MLQATYQESSNAQIPIVHNKYRVKNLFSVKALCNQVDSLFCELFQSRKLRCAGLEYRQVTVTVVVAPGCARLRLGDTGVLTDLIPTPGRHWCSTRLVIVKQFSLARAPYITHALNNPDVPCSSSSELISFKSFPKRSSPSFHLIAGSFR